MELKRDGQLPILNCLPYKRGKDNKLDSTGYRRGENTCTDRTITVGHTTQPTSEGGKSSTKQKDTLFK